MTQHWKQFLRLCISIVQKCAYIWDVNRLPALTDQYAAPIISGHLSYLAIFSLQKGCSDIRQVLLYII